MLLSKEMHLSNLKLALKKWEETPPEKVVYNLARWRLVRPCGTTACFGGHLATWPEFQAMGIELDDEMVPSSWLPTNGLPYISGVAVAERLFGDKGLFEQRGHGGETFEQEELTDHELVTWRIKRQIAKLEEASPS